MKIKLKLMLFILVVSSTLTVNAQFTDSILYRDYPNRIQISSLGFENCELKALENVSVKDIGNGTYILSPGGNKTASILVVNSNQQIQDTIYFFVQNPPRPEIFLCGIENGKPLVILCDSIEVRYVDGVRLTDHFEVVSYQIEIPRLSIIISGKGNIIQDFTDLNAQLRSGDTISLVVVYNDRTRGKMRRSNGLWIIQ